MARLRTFASTITRIEPHETAGATSDVTETAKRPARKRAPARKTTREAVWRTIEQLKPDPANVNTHSASQIEHLRASLRRFGQPRNILIDRKDVVIAGNGLLEAAQLEGCAGLWCDIWDGTAELAVAYGIADNRLARMSSFDDELLREMLSRLDVAEELRDAMGWDAAEFEQLLSMSTPDDDDDTSPGLGAMEYRIVIECRDEAQQRDLLERLEGEGLDCRAVMS